MCEWKDIGDLMCSGYCDDCDMDPALCYEAGKCYYEEDDDCGS